MKGTIPIEAVNVAEGIDSNEDIADVRIDEIVQVSVGKMMGGKVRKEDTWGAWCVDSNGTEETRMPRASSESQKKDS